MYFALWVCVTVVCQLILPTKALATPAPVPYNITDIDSINNVTDSIQGRPSSFEGAIEHGLKFLAYYANGPLDIWRIALKPKERRSARAADFRNIRLIAVIRGTNQLIYTDAEYLFDWAPPAFMEKPQPPAVQANFRAWDWQERKVTLEKAMALSQVRRTPTKWRGIGLLWRTREASIAFEFHTSDIDDEVDISAVNGVRLMSLPPVDSSMQNSTVQNATSRSMDADVAESR